MALSKKTKEALVVAITNRPIADEIERRFLTSTPANSEEAAALAGTFDTSKKMEKSIEQYLTVCMAGNGSEGREIARKMNGIAKVVKAKSIEVPGAAATAELDSPEPIILTSTELGAARNDFTFLLRIAAGAANVDDAVFVEFEDDDGDIICTVTPNSNYAITLTSEEIVELINTGDVVGKNVQITDPDDQRERQTASGGDNTDLTPGTLEATEIQTITFAEFPAFGSYRVRWNGNSSTLIQYNADNSEIYTAITAIPGLETIGVAGGSLHAGTKVLTLTFTGLEGINVAAVTIEDNTVVYTRHEQQKTFIATPQAPTSGNIRIYAQDPDESLNNFQVLSVGAFSNFDFQAALRGITLPSSSFQIFVFGDSVTDGYLARYLDFAGDIGEVHFSHNTLKYGTVSEINEIVVLQAATEFDIDGPAYNFRLAAGTLGSSAIFYIEVADGVNVQTHPPRDVPGQIMVVTLAAADTPEQVAQKINDEINAAAYSLWTATVDTDTVTVTHVSLGLVSQGVYANNTSGNLSLTTTTPGEAEPVTMSVQETMAYTPGLPDNAVVATNPDGSPESFGDSFEGTFEDGVSGVSAGLEEAKEEMGSEPLNKANLECLIVALADEKAAKEFKAAYDAAVGFAQDVE